MKTRITIMIDTELLNRITQKQQEDDEKSRSVMIEQLVIKGLDSAEPTDKISKEFEKRLGDVAVNVKELIKFRLYAKRKLGSQPVGIR